MKITLAKAAGFCMGVRRAMQTVIGQARRGPGPVRTYGPLIHNPQVIEMLKTKGIEPLPKEGGRDGKGTVVIRAHGVRPEEKESLCGCGFNVVDATCPHVIRIQKLITKYVADGHSILIVGDRGHAEVEGLLGYAGDKGHAVSTEADVAALPDLEKVCVVSQTTQSFERFEKMLSEIRRRWPDCTVHRTICGSTDRRQAETVELARRVDAMIVVGGKNSANTVRLAELAADTGTPTFHVETSDDLDLDRLRGLKNIGLTAGASTPNWMIAEVVERLKETARSELPFPYRACVAFFKFLLSTHLDLALGAFGMGLGCVAMESLLGVGVFPLGSLIAGSLFIFSMYLLNIPSEREAERYSDPLRWRFHLEWGRVLIRTGYALVGAAVLLSAFLGVYSFLLMTLAALAGVLYRTTIIPSPLLPGLGGRRLNDIPGSKDLFMGLAWAVMLTVLPVLSRESGDLFALAGDPRNWFSVAVPFFYVFTLVFARSVVFDLREIQSDQIVGRETIPVVLGKERTRVLLAALTSVLLLTMIAALRWGTLSSAGYLMLIPVLYTWGYLYLYHRRAIIHGIPFEAIVDGKFLLVGALALLWFWLSPSWPPAQ